MFTIVMLAISFGYLFGLDDASVSSMKVGDIVCMLKCISVAFVGDLVVLALNIAYHKVLALIKK